MARKIKSMEEASALIPWIVAEAVAREATAHCRDDVPMGYAGTLQARAEACYDCDAHFRKKIRGAGNTGRNYLYMFMRHWLAGILKEKHFHLFQKLPPDFALGKN